MHRQSIAGLGLITLFYAGIFVLVPTVIAAALLLTVWPWSWLRDTLGVTTNGIDPLILGALIAILGFALAALVNYLIIGKLAGRRRHRLTPGKTTPG